MRKSQLVILALVSVGLLVGGALYLIEYGDFWLLDTKGSIADQERDLMFLAAALSLIVVIPVYAMLFGFAWRYRESNPKKTKYRPNWGRNNWIEAVWWGVPLILIGILSVVTWHSTHQLDPFRPIKSSQKTMTVQAVALQWKWLFIYPQQDLASVNYLQIPVNTPIKFQITADAPMNALWIPELGGQMYAMSGMSTNLNLIANQPGRYQGMSSNISGEGFAGMRFTVKAVNQDHFAKWAKDTGRSGKYLSREVYQKLALPSENSRPITYTGAEPGLYDSIIDKYRSPDTQFGNIRSNAHKEGSY